MRCSPTTPGRARSSVGRTAAWSSTSWPAVHSFPCSGSAIPVTWRARTWHEPATRRLRFVHVAGATKGMDVTWPIEPAGDAARTRVTIEHDFEPRLPGFAAIRRSLVHPSDRGSDAGDLQGPGRGGRPISRRTGRTPRHDRSTTRLDHRHRHHHRRSAPASTAFRAGLRAGRSPVRTIDRFDPSPFRSHVAAQIDDFDPLDWMPPKTARQLDRFSQFGLVGGPPRPRGRRVHAGRARRRRAGAGRDLPRLGARRDRLRGGPARALPRARHPAGRPEPRAGRVRRRGAGQPWHRARRARPDPVHRELVRLGCGGARRGAR